MTTAGLILIGVLLVVWGAVKTVEAWDEHKAETARARAAAHADYVKASDEALAIANHRPLEDWQHELLQPTPDDLELARRRRNLPDA